MSEQQYFTTGGEREEEEGGESDSTFQSTRYSKLYENAVTNILWHIGCPMGQRVHILGL